MLKLVDDDVARIDITDVVPVKIAGDVRWTGKAKFPGTPRARSIVIFQLGDNVVAISAFCPHEQANLAEGRFVAPFVLECPLHHNHYDLRNGAIKTFRVDMDGERMYLLWRRSANEPVAPSFATQVKLGQRTDDERASTLEQELTALREAAQVREAHMVETLRQMEGMIREVEDKKRTVEASHGELAKLNEFVTRVTDSMSEVLVVIDPGGAVREVNARFVRLLGYARDEVLGTPLARLVAADDADSTTRPPVDASLLSGQRDAELEARLVAKSGQAIDHLLRIAPLYGKGGKREGAVLVGTEIQAFKAAQRELNAAYGKVANLLDNMRQAVFVVEPSGEIIDPVSRFALQMFGAEIVGRNVFEVLYRDIPREGELFAGLETAFLTVFGAEEFQWDLMADLLPRRIVQRREEGSEALVVILKVDYCPLRDSQGLMDKLMVVVEDVTKIESLEQEKRRGERSTQILEELARNRVEDLRAFLGAAYAQLRTSRQLLDRDADDTEARTVLFRELHTLKGNARVLGLTLIAQATHEAENVASALRTREEDTPLARERTREAVNLVQRQVAEYSEVAERILHVPNDLEAHALAELHGAVTAIDAQLGRPRSQPGQRASTSPFAHPASDALVRSATACREAADAAGSEPVSRAARALGQALLASIHGGLQGGAALATEVHMAHQALLDAAIARRLASHTGTAYSLATSSWTSLYLDVFALTEAALSACTDADQALTLERAAERVMSSAGALHAEYVAALVARIPPLLTTRDPYCEAEPVLRELWRHLALHSTLESLALLRPEERTLLSQALAHAESGDGELVGLLEAGRVRTGTLVGFLGSLRQKGVAAGHVLATLQQLFGSTDTARVAQMFVNTRQHEHLPTLLASVDAHSAPSAFDAWAAELGAQFQLFPVGPSHGLGYLKRLDVLRLAHAVRELVSGNFQLLFDRVHTVEVMAYHYGQLQRGLDALRHDRSDAAIEALERSIAQLLDVPLIPSLYKYYAMVSEISSRLGKRVALQIHGDGTTALPRDQLYALHDALVHLIRNAVDHGLEPSADRVAHGKPEIGVIEVACQVAHAALQVTLRDDGRGIDPRRVLKKALDLGLVSPAQAAAMDDQAAVELVFLPHFSTAGSVTDISGRGIGMDAVRDSLRKIGASLRIDSQVGHGTTFTIVLSRAPSSARSSQPVH